MNVVNGVTLRGIEALKVEVEVEMTGGLSPYRWWGSPTPR